MILIDLLHFIYYGCKDYVKDCIYNNIYIYIFLLNFAYPSLQIDIVFEEWDEGFIATVNNFMATSKRPIILTVSDLSPNVLAKIKGNYEKLDFVSPPEDLIGMFTYLMC